jgi:hypothetical protein
MILTYEFGISLCHKILKCRCISCRFTLKKDCVASRVAMIARATKQVRTEKGGNRGEAVSGTQQRSVFYHSNFLAAFKRLGCKLDEDYEAFPDWELLNEVRFGSFPHGSAC